jgi:geranylgeranyl diphosphate synthase type II
MRVEAYMADCRQAVLEHIRSLLPPSSPVREALYERILDYPLRRAKAIRPSLCMATCRALGGRAESVLPSAAALELYHNAFLIHDDVEDGSEKRRDEMTLHRKYGVPIAVNVGDAMLALSLEPLLSNMELVGLSKALRVLSTVSRMARVSSEGQALELEWIREGSCPDLDHAYIRMVYQKTCWYTFVAPVHIGALIAGAPESQLNTLSRFATALGVAFQIQDDLLNLEGDEVDYGKEALGDLWEGKRTLILIHALRSATDGERSRALAILRRPRPSLAPDSRPDLRAEIDSLVADGHLSMEGAERLRRAATVGDNGVKSTVDVDFLFSLIRKYGSIAYARAVARRRAIHARKLLGGRDGWIPGSVHRSFLESLVDYVVERSR